MKRVKGKEYLYLVENTWKKKTRQKVKKYLGAVTRLESKDLFELPDEQGKEAQEILRDVVHWELAKAGFIRKGNNFEREDIAVTNMRLKKGKKKAVLALNDGYLCDYTLKQILTFRTSGDIKNDSIELARLFVDAGLNAPKEVFIAFFKALK